MSDSLFKTALLVLALGFTAAFVAICVPPLIENPDILGAFGQGFVNPFSTGYSLDVLTCWAVLAVWIIRDARVAGIRHGWIALVLGIVPGVAVGFAFYLWLRSRDEARRA